MADTRVNGAHASRRLVLAGTLAAAVWTLVTTFVTTIVADRYKTNWSTPQDKLFADRLTAYSEILLRADDTLSALNEVYRAPRNSSESLPFETWSPVVGNLDVKYCKTYPTRCSGGGGGSIDFDPESVITALRKFDEARRKYRMLIPDHLDKPLSNFIRATASVVDAQLEPKGRADVDERNLATLRQGWTEALQAHRELANELRRTLGLDCTQANTLTVC